MSRSAAFLCAVLLSLTVSAQLAFPEINSRSEALQALENPDARYRASAVAYIGRTGLAADGPLLVKRLADESPFVRDLAQQSVWLVWSRSGDAETDRLLMAGLEHMNNGRHKQAIDAFTQVIKRKPDFAEGWNKRATAHYIAGDLQKSLADCDEVMKRNPQHFGALAGYGQIYFQLEQYEKSIEYFKRALVANPNMSGIESNIRAIEEVMRDKRRKSI